MTGFGPYARARVPDRKYLWTVVGLFALLGLTGLGALLYRPLRIRYAVYKIQHTTWEQWRLDFDQGKDFAYADCLKECTEAASRGNCLAIEAVIDVSGFGDGYIAETTGEIAYRVAARQPARFFEMLGRRSDAQVLKVMGDIAAACAAMDTGAECCGTELSSASALTKKFRELSQSETSEAGQVAQAALNFIRKRFARELTEAPADG